MRRSVTFRATFRSAKFALGFYLHPKAWRFLWSRPFFPFKLWRVNPRYTITGFLFERL